MLAGENRELKQASEKSMKEFQAQVHSLEMASSDKDTCIEKYQAMIRHQEGERALFHGKYIKFSVCFWLQRIAISTKQFEVENVLALAILW